jgi:hypothetical protein
LLAEPIQRGSHPLDDYQFLTSFVLFGIRDGQKGKKRPGRHTGGGWSDEELYEFARSRGLTHGQIRELAGRLGESRAVLEAAMRLLRD